MIVGTVVAAVGAAGVAASGLGFGDDGTDRQSASNLPPARTQVSRQTLQDTDEASGDLGYGGQTVLPGRVPGIITGMPLAGDLITRGRAIYRVDNTPVVLLYGALPAYRELTTGSEGADVQQLEDNLRALGYGSGITVDQKYTSATAQAVSRWQKDLGLTQTGRVELGRVVFAPGTIRVDSVTAGLNQSARDGQEVLKYTGTTRRVTARLDVSKQRLARKGALVQIELPDGTRVPGVVDRVYTVIEPAVSQGSDPTTKIEAIVSLNNPDAVATIEAAVVTVVFTADEHKDVLTVPVGALVALNEGGYGVEVIEGTSTRFVKVRTGLFANGRVEVSGDGLREGMTVGIPQ
ncbi:peptidoglycan-binding domain-containing protein [Dactylosporangium darangshiense]|uniref:peptidoglycan-binding domain-containing protein n=1 Tax=Dactylosporangium darangshiense TaxID=579108 RepID=UPI0031F04FC6